MPGKRCAARRAIAVGRYTRATVLSRESARAVAEEDAIRVSPPGGRYFSSTGGLITIIGASIKTRPARTRSRWQRQ